MRVEALLETAAHHTPDKTALVSGDIRFSYRQLDEQANRLAHALIAAGIEPGERVVICRGNSIETVAAIFAVLKAGAIFVVVNPQSRADRLAERLDDCAAAALFAEAPVIRPGHTRLFTTFDAPAYPSTPPRAPGTEQDLAALVYTSGSTGESKGVMLTHRNLLSAADAICEYLELTADDVILSVLPLAFTYGLGQITTAFRSGATVVLEPSSLYPRAMLDTMARECVTGLPLVPTMATLILQQDLTNVSFPHLRYITNAAAALSNVKVRQLQKAFPHAKLYSMYGQTECQRVSYLPPDQLDAKPASVGIAIPGTRVWIVDAEGNRVAPGSIGELVVSGPHVMRGYWNQPDQTARVLRCDDVTGIGELHTGDLFRMDSDGFLYFVDRLDDMIKTRGEKVAPRQIEEVIAQLPAVAEVSVYGVPDELLGEAVAASVALVPGTRLSRARIQRHCLEHLESFMVPRQIDIREALPTGANGKVNRRA
ncbi:MAG TPA: class I adenylate-forming enzyme family protein, partial [Vicinamibacterales bacterium]